MVHKTPNTSPFHKMDYVYLVERVIFLPPHFMELAGSLIGRRVAVQAACMLKQGVLQAVCADYLTLETCGIPFFIRTDEVVFLTVT